MRDLLSPPTIWEKNYSEIEAAVVSGRHQECRELFDSLNPKTIPREWASRYAELANRVHHSLYALKALHRFVMKDNQLDASASDREKMIYAYALCLLGATDEALALLDRVDSAKEPESFFLKSLTLFRQWKYSQSIPLLKAFMEASGVANYRRLVGEVNLVAALISASEWTQALEHIDDIQSVCKKESYSLLLGNSFELKAQIYFFQKKYDESLICLRSAGELLKGQQGLYLLFVEKWTLLCRLFMNPSDENIEKLRALRMKASQLNDFETVRECELFEAVAMKNEDLLRKVIMGTPSEAYRQRARQLFGKSLKPLGQFVWDLNLRSSKMPVVFDPYQKRNCQTALYEKPHLLALFEALSVDFYRPCHLGALFRRVYPTEKFNPYSSPARVMRLLKRLDEWFEENQVPIRIDFKKSEFSLKASASVQVMLQRGQKLSAHEGRWSQIRKAFEGRTFTTSKISQAIGISQTSAQRLIRQALQEGRIRPIGQGRGAAYQFLPRNKSRQAA